MSSRIVVGVDGSPHARRALVHAVAEARLRGAVVDAVLAYAPPADWSAPEFGVLVPRAEADVVEDARRLLDRELVDVPDDVHVEPIVVAGPAARALLETAKGADLLVVGSRGRGGFMGLLLGSTSHQVVTHATCPVVVVPTVDEDTDRQDSGSSAA
jgi:nucleotide-binding universal stress UspA family protein